MADHDRDDGSRGEEEAPRDPNPGPPPRGQDDDTEGPDPAHTVPPYAAGPDPRTEAGPDPRVGDTAFSAAAPPREAYPPRDGSLRDFVRQRHTQVFGAALIGLIVGALLGGIAVALISSMVHRGDRRDHYIELPAWRHERGGCHVTPGGMWCPPPYPDGRAYPMPMPTAPMTPPATPRPTSS